ncbi:MAG: acyltransferase [Prolixibacteraceae bacterium]|jgi:peptidoglycan/LPS O-acetylase OafA/YrhL|nr:acyltransferase [Prolixibacteraceae bacterium]
MSKRLFYLDNLKIALTFLVIVHHVGQAYGPTGGFWPFISSDNDSISWLGRFFSVNAAFFMGFFFMISGYFFSPSYSRKGIFDYSKDKLIRFGIPLLFAYLIMVPSVFYFYYVNYSGNPHLTYWEYFKEIFLGVTNKPEWFKPSIGWPESNFGFAHLWFIEHLLIYSLLYGVIRLLFSKVNFGIKQINQYAVYFVLLIIITAASIVVRKNYPIDSWVDIFGFITSEPAHLPQYFALSIIGIIAYKYDLFNNLNAKFCKILVGIGLAIVIIVYFMPIMPDFVKRTIDSNTELFETTLCISLCFGLIGVMRDYGNKTNGFLKILSANSYGAYIFHFPIVILLQYLFDTVEINILVKFIVVSILSIFSSYTFTIGLRKIEVLKKII